MAVSIIQTCESIRFDLVIRDSSGRFDTLATYTIAKVDVKKSTSIAAEFFSRQDNCRYVRDEDARCDERSQCERYTAHDRSDANDLVVGTPADDKD